jgi:threonine/homoserine/homoserine lactone efflux protein
MLTYILQGLALGFAAAVQPGPFMAYLISQTLTLGWKRAWIAAFAPLISDGPIIALALLVLSQMPAWLERGLFFASGFFILYLAWSAYRQWRNPTEALEPPPAPGNQSLLRAALMNALSPMPYIYWSLVTGPILLSSWQRSPAHGISFLAAFYGVLISCLLLLIALFSSARQLGTKVSHTLLGLSALALAGFGLFQLWRGISG